MTDDSNQKARVSKETIDAAVAEAKSLLQGKKKGMRKETFWENLRSKGLYPENHLDRGAITFRTNIVNVKGVYYLKALAPRKKDAEKTSENVQSGDEMQLVLNGGTVTYDDGKKSGTVKGVIKIIIITAPVVGALAWIGNAIGLL